MESISRRELNGFEADIAAATDMWRRLCESEFKRKGDHGCCTLGSGIAVQCIEPRCRNPRETIIIHAHDVCRWQGAGVWEASVQQVVDWLTARGVPAYYLPGRMD